ncbi:NAD(P)H-dependent oxidoreductase [Winogradskyella undariae]|uniref:NAD(P)H-dependent oxidoreductase n=1 Tax=Winogradskyella TaxID=286104 RepID=UPI00156AC87E|nr:MULTISPECIES: NAD(P)H-dependent oxidoreductase [Winogradskyella]NRR93171.1 NAD(P)H-dependent oxidoreductase [Winogradskyella undariae]QNK77900.1 NAD(P)H-dependent oxidoreductase [Winogradskyella sp. PAMC22761]QXP79091.1 NAD(P)H-dependent oxidoreductase [Winogradskyella sp. HaHa_3_26]
MNTPNIAKADILNAFNFRHATKEFDATKKVSDEDMKFILETAHLSPSSFGFEPWHFIVVQDKELRELLKPVAWGAPLKLDTASHFVLGLSMKAPMVKHDSEYIMHMMKDVKQLPQEVIEMYSTFYREFQERDFDLDTDKKLFDWSSKQTYIALGNMMTAAALIGIDSCPIEGFHQEKAEALLKDKFGVDTDKYGLSFMTAFGYRKADPEFGKSRRNFEDIVTFK